MTSLVDSFADVKDPRVERTREHPLINLIVIAICGAICGADSWVEIETFAEAKKAWLSTYLDLSKGIPSHDTFGRVFARIDAEQFQTGFSRWIMGINRKIEREGSTEVVAIDGKQLRRSHDKAVGKEAIYMVSAWATEAHLVLGQRKVDEKSNEITAIPLLLDTLALAGCIVTIDAMGCQKKIAQTIVDQQADYVLSLKGNNGNLYEDTVVMFDYFEKIEFEGVAHTYTRTVNKGHGRVEIRECWSFDPQPWASYFRTLEEWTTVHSLSMVLAERKIDGVSTIQKRFFISSLVPDSEQILTAVRSHWGIENGLHWVLDIAFREDESRIRMGNGAENMAVLRHIAVSLLKQERSTKIGIKAKRLKCGWDEEYLLKVLQI